MQRFVWWAAACLVGVASCSSGVDGEREPVDTGTFGNTVVTLACKRMAYLESVAAYEAGAAETIDVAGDAYRDECRLGLAFPADAPNPLHALHAKRDPLVSAVDATFPEEFLGDLQTFLTSTELLALYDDGTTIAAIDSLIAVLDMLADDAELAPALERLNHRLGYTPVTPSLGTARLIVNYPQLHELLLELTRAITEGGMARREFDDLIAATSVALRNAEVAEDAGAPDRTAALALDLLFTESPYLGTSRALPLVRRDRRGLALVTDTGGALPEPFADTDGDGLADADGLGRYLDDQGAPFAAPAPFALPAGEEQVPWPHRDEQGRALVDAGGDPLYQFVDLDKTVLAALTRDALELFDPDRGTALDLLRGVSLLVGPRVMTTRTYASGDSIEYRGYDSAASPLLDVLYGYDLLLTDPNIYDTLELTRQLFRDHDAEAARLIEALIATSRAGDAYPNAQLEPGSPLFDDLMPVFIEILETPGLAEDMLRAMESPEMAELGLRFAEHMKHKDQILIDASTQALIGSLSTPVDRGAVDSGNNRSLMQRLLHLIHDSNGAELCNKQGAVVRDPFVGFVIATYDECELLQIDNLAVFYLQSIAYAKDGSGNVIYDNIDGTLVPRPKARFPFEFDNALIESIVDDDLLESESGIEGFRFNPTPQALNRSLFLQPQPAFLADAMDPTRCIEGDRFIDKHDGTLMVWELNGFYDQVRPLVQAFADHDAERLFIDLMTVLHDHYPSRDSIEHQQSNPGGAYYAYASNTQSYEPVLIDILEDRKLMDALVFNAPVLNGLTVGGRSSVQVMARAARFILLPRAGLTDRYGNTSTTTEDGRPVDTLSPWYVLAEAHQRKRAALGAAATEGAAWRGAVTNTVDVLLRGDAVVGSGWRFRNRRLRGVILALVDFLDSRLQAHDAASDRDAWLRDDLPARIEDVVTSPVFAGLADFAVSITNDSDARFQLEALMAYLVDEVANTDVFWTSVTSAADILQFALDDADIVPVVRAIGDVLRPELGLLTPQLEFAKAARASDETEALAAIMRNLFAEHRPGHTAVGDLIDGITEVNRMRPYEDLGEPYSAEDYRASLRAVAVFLGEEKRGLRKFIQIIQSRNP